MFSFLYLYIIRIQLALCKSGRFISTNDSLLSIYCETQFVMWHTLQYVFASIDVICFGWLFPVRCHAAYFHLSSSSVQRSICLGIYFAKHTSKPLQHTIYIYKDGRVRLVLLTSIVMLVQVIGFFWPSHNLTILLTPDVHLTALSMDIL